MVKTPPNLYIKPYIAQRDNSHFQSVLLAVKSQGFFEAKYMFQHKICKCLVQIKPI